jgi:predicted nucleic acid-binding protein
MSRLLLDTNILLDAVMRERPQSAEARQVLDRCNGWGDMGLVAAVSLKDLYYVLGKCWGEPTARECVERLMGLVVVAPVGGEEADLALHAGEPDFEDGLVRACAELNDVDFIITRDAAAFRKSSVRSVSAAEYLEIVG